MNTDTERIRANPADFLQQEEDFTRHNKTRTQPESQPQRAKVKKSNKQTNTLDAEEIRDLWRRSFFEYDEGHCTEKKGGTDENREKLKSLEPQHRKSTPEWELAAQDQKAAVVIIEHRFF